MAVIHRYYMELKINKAKYLGCPWYIFTQYNEAVFIVYLSFSIRIEKGKEEGKWGKRKSMKIGN